MVNESVGGLLPSKRIKEIDGVLVPKRKFENPLKPEELLSFDPTCLQTFEEVLRHHPTALVVISFSWREIFSFDLVRPLFSPEIATRVVGFTPFLDPETIHKLQYLRHQEVLEFLR